MLFRASLSFAAVAALVASSIAACSSTDAAPVATPQGSACAAYVPPSSFDPTTPAVAFGGDPVTAASNAPTVMKVILQSCTLATCHGSLTGPAGGMYLGPDLSKTYSNIVGVAATTYPVMLRVKAGDPANSFLQHRIDGDSCTLSGCTDQTCSELMPQGQDLLAVNDRLTFRAWIAQGAKADFTVVTPDAGAGDDGGGAANDAGDAGTPSGDDAGDASDASGE